MTNPLKPTNPSVTNAMGKFLKQEFADYDLSYGDVAYLMDTTVGAVSHWRLGKNGASHANTEKLAFLFGVTVNQIVDTGVYEEPALPIRPNMVEFVREVYDMVKGPVSGVKSHEFRIDVKRRCEDFMKAREMLDTKPATYNLNDTLSELDKHQLRVAGPGPAVPKIPQVSASDTEANQIKMFLHQANRFAASNDLQWVVKADGTLGAKRVTTEEF